MRTKLGCSGGHEQGTEPETLNAHIMPHNELEIHSGVYAAFKSSWDRPQRHLQKGISLS